jgi:glycosyltransferase involved in cell wall biosynthesis
MRIAHVVHSYFPRIGGIERVVQYLAEEQAKLGHRVTVITSNVDLADSSKEERINGINVIRLRSRKLLYNDLIIPLEEPPIEDVDIVHAYSQNSLFSIIIGDRAKKMGCKVAFQFLAVDALSDHPNPIMRYLGSLYSKRCTLKALKFSDLKFVMGFRDRHILKSRYRADHIYILPDGVSQQYFTIPRSDAEEFREKFKIRQEKFFLFIGRIHKLKGPHIIIKALKNVGKDVAAVFIGPDDGYLRECLRLASVLGVRNRIYMLGYVDERTKIAAIDSAIAVISPSLCNYVEVFPISIWEAWARSKPVIASKVGDIPYRIKHSVNGLLFNPSDHIQLSNLMSILLNNRRFADNLGKKGKRYILTWDKIALKALRLYESIV